MPDQPEKQNNQPPEGCGSADDGRSLPEWAPRDAGLEFASRVMRGVRLPGGSQGAPKQSVSNGAGADSAQGAKSGEGYDEPGQRNYGDDDNNTNAQSGTEHGAEHERDPFSDKPGMQVAGAGSPARKRRRRQQLGRDDYVKGVLAGDRTVLARAITLVESGNPDHERLAQEVLKEAQPKAGKSLRVGITGVPGAGKSTLIETLGVHLCDQDHKVAVLAVDPSSARTGGSILGDKTRMENLSRQPGAFIRPSPSGGELGGVARKTRETMLLCEAAGYDIILIETVGVGQSEVLVRSMSDFFLLVLIAGAGDELQGIKKGVIELADMILVNKADGDNERRAKGARAEFERILHYLQPATEGWETPARICSALQNTGIAEMWAVIEDFHSQMQETGRFEQRRREQNVEWMRGLVEELLLSRFRQNPEVAAALPEIEQSVAKGNLPALIAAEQLYAISQGKARSTE